MSQLTVNTDLSEYLPTDPQEALLQFIQSNDVQNEPPQQPPPEEQIRESANRKLRWILTDLSQQVKTKTQMKRVMGRVLDLARFRVGSKEQLLGRLMNLRTVSKHGSKEEANALLVEILMDLLA